MFALRAKKVASIEEYFRDCNLKNLIRVLGGKDVFIEEAEQATTHS